MKVGEVARATGVSIQAVRFYERRGLLPTPQRLQSGYRDYGAGTVPIITLIKQMQEVGFTLRELAHFVHLLETEPHHPAERRACVEAKLQSIDEQIERLRLMRNELSTRLQTCQCCNLHSLKPDGEAEGENRFEKESYRDGCNRSYKDDCLIDYSSINQSGGSDNGCVAKNE
jgi:MerR family mercuric resistance operon transcriptional regulator